MGGIGEHMEVCYIHVNVIIGLLSVYIYIYIYIYIELPSYLGQKNGCIIQILWYVVL